MEKAACKKILIVDDNKSVLKKVQSGLESHGFVVVAFEDPQKALNAVSSEFSCIITDYEMPTLNGPEFCRAVKEKEDCESIPLVVFTSKDNSSYLVEAFKAGADDYILKSHSVELVAIKVENMIKLRGLRQKEMAFEKLEAIQEMIVTYNHEINNPLTVAVAHISLLKPKIENEKAMNSLAKLEMSIKRISEVMKKIKEVRRYQTVNYTKTSKMIDINQDKKVS